MMVVRSTLLAMAVIALSTSPAAALDNEFTFQGRLVLDELPVEGTVDLRFSLWDAASDGAQVGTSQTFPGTEVSNGLINVVLNAGDEFGAGAFDGEERWIEVNVDSETLSPRHKITATPYALTAVTLTPGAQITGRDDVVTVTSTGGSSNHALSGIATAGGASPAGVYGRADGSNGRGVFGEATATSGAGAGVRGVSQSEDSNATGVFGLLIEANATGAGVKGQNNGTTGYGVWGQGGANATGVLGQTNGASARGVWAYNSGSGVALRAESGGSLIEGWDLSPVNLRFRVDNAGNVTADGTFTSPAADFAEMLPATDGLEPGDVLVVQRDGILGRSQHAYEPAVVGVHSTTPAFLGGSPVDGADAGSVPLAVVGIVPVKASAENGAISAGDMLVASATPGHAMHAGDAPPQGTVIGKALSDLREGTGTIRLLVILQ